MVKEGSWVNNCGVEKQEGEERGEENAASSKGEGKGADGKNGQVERERESDRQGLARFDQPLAHHSLLHLALVVHSSYATPFRPALPPSALYCTVLADTQRLYHLMSSCPTLPIPVHLLSCHSTHTTTLLDCFDFFPLLPYSSHSDYSIPPHSSTPSFPLYP